MKRMSVGRVCLPLFALMALVACKKDNVVVAEVPLPELSLKSFHEEAVFRGVSGSMPDTSSFILSVKDGEGTSLYKGRYGDRPADLTVPAGSCVLSIWSYEFVTPAFDAPLYGDEQVIVVEEGQKFDVRFECRQLNSGIRARFSEAFLEKFPDRSLMFRSGEHSINYPYDETRIAYFMPGRIEAVLQSGEEEEVLTGHILNAAEVLTVNFSTSDGKATGEVSVTLDTTRVWLYDDYTYGRDGSTMYKALSVSSLKSRLDCDSLWVEGYIVGSFVNSKLVLGAVGAGTSNIAIAASPEETDTEKIAPVELKSAKFKNPLNLVDNPGNISKKVAVLGNIETYFSTVGVKSLTDYFLWD